MAGSCQLRIEAPDDVATSMITVDLERRGMTVAREQPMVLVVNAPDQSTALALTEVVKALSAEAKVTVDGAEPATSTAGAAATNFPVVVSPAALHRDKWNDTLKRVEMQISRDAGRSVEGSGSTFAVRNFESAQQADQAAAAIAAGIRTKRNMETVVLVVPDNAAPLLVNAEADRRELLRQLGYAVDTSYMVQIQLGDPLARSELRTRIEQQGVKVAEKEERLLIGFASEDEAKRVVEAAALPADAALQVSHTALDLELLGKQLASIRSREQADSRWVGHWWDVTGFGGLDF